MKKLIISIFTGLTLCASNAYSGTVGPIAPPAPQMLPWSVIASGGYGDYRNAGNTGIGRLALAKEMFPGPWYLLGIEVGVEQTWKRDFKKTFTFDSIPIQVNPMIDVLFTGKFSPWVNQGIFVQAKAGVVYRNWHAVNFFFDPNGHSDLGLEGQLGLGYAFNDWLSLSLLYQGIARDDCFFGRENASLFNHLPYLNAGLLSLAVAI